MALQTKLAAAVLAGAFLIGASATWAADAARYEPAEGDAVVVYVHRFKPADYEKARDIVENGFGKAMEAHGQKRRTYFLENEENHEVMAVSFFHPEGTVEAWQSAPQRLDVLKQLEPLRREPIIIWHYTVGRHHAVE